MPPDDAADTLIDRFFWRRVDGLGSDVCELHRLVDGWRLDGSAVFRECGFDCRLDYLVEADVDFRARGARLSGRCGARRIAIDVEREPRSVSGWRVDGQPLALPVACPDIDLAFTPSTNLLALRRLGLAVGEGGESQAVWLKLPEFVFRHLPQHYRRVRDDAYAYAAPSVGYEDQLMVRSDGAVVRYPGLFVLAEPGRDRHEPSALQHQESRP